MFHSLYSDHVIYGLSVKQVDHILSLYYKVAYYVIVEEEVMMEKLVIIPVYSNQICDDILKWLHCIECGVL